MKTFARLPLPLQRLITVTVALFLVFRFAALNGVPDSLIRRLRDRRYFKLNHKRFVERQDAQIQKLICLLELVHTLCLYMLYPPRLRRQHLTVLQTTSTPPCTSCSALCCKRLGDRGFSSVQIVLTDLPGMFFMRPSSLFHLVPSINRYPEFQLFVQESSSCIFLGDDDRCTIYAGRPTACRIFNCVDEWDFSRRRFGSTTGAHGFVESYPEMLEVFKHAGIDPVPTKARYGEEKTPRRL